MFTPHKQGDTTVVDAYNQMVSRVKYSLENAEAQAIPSLQKAMQQAVNEAVHLGEISIVDAEEISNYIKHDINDSIEYLVEYSRDFSGWLLLDIDIIEQKVMELFLSVADQTRIELDQLARTNHLDK
ncbi:hypothetical protein MNBD_GAMMA07-2489 [hydrothermal vent metagenome]|uniref:Uncharacterized protein n=1 Tax=hydrothermal vent metagenome TaxID=652676 RepID=A0A3B0WW12_9ZZZZ